ncbi:MAG TPA: hypothetical protein VMN36_08180 [Verrucomicrobiales bacterium]|nr:hypothetical protein [Verrucomicrobiales bacterium]
MKLSLALGGVGMLVLCGGCDVVSPPPAPYYDYQGGSRYSGQGRSYPQGSNPNTGYYDPRSERNPAGTANRPYYPGAPGAPPPSGGGSTTPAPRRDPLTDLDPNSVNPDPGSRTSGTTGGGTTSGSNTGATTPAAPEYPYGAKVPGKEGHVYSPYAQDKIVDVRDIPHGTKVYCPFTNKIFLVP